MAVCFRRGRMPFPTRADPRFQIVHVPQDVTDARAAHTDHLRIAIQELRVFRGRCKSLIQSCQPCSCTRFDVRRSIRGRSGPFKDTCRMAIVDCEIQTAARLQDAVEFQKPRFDQVVEVCEHRACVNQAARPSLWRSKTAGIVAPDASGQHSPRDTTPQISVFASDRGDGE